jgi:hypothetical protein
MLAGLAGLGMLGLVHMVTKSMTEGRSGDFWNKLLMDEPDRHKTKIPKDICSVSRNLTPYLREQLTGKSDGKIPKDMSGTFAIDGHTFVVLAHKAGPIQNRHRWSNDEGKYVKSTVHAKVAKHRIFWQAPDGTLVPSGRLHQSKACGKTGGSRTRSPKGRFTGRAPRR